MNIINHQQLIEELKQAGFNVSTVTTSGEVQEKVIDKEGAVSFRWITDDPKVKAIIEKYDAGDVQVESIEQVKIRLNELQSEVADLIVIADKVASIPLTK